MFFVTYPRYGLVIKPHDIVVRKLGLVRYGRWVVVVIVVSIDLVEIFVQSRVVGHLVLEMAAALAVVNVRGPACLKVLVIVIAITGGFGHTNEEVKVVGVSFKFGKELGGKVSRSRSKLAAYLWKDHFC